MAKGKTKKQKQKLNKFVNGFDKKGFDKNGYHRILINRRNKKMYNEQTKILDSEINKWLGV